MILVLPIYYSHHSVVSPYLLIHHFTRPIHRLLMIKISGWNMLPYSRNCRIKYFLRKNIWSENVCIGARRIILYLNSTSTKLWDLVQCHPMIFGDQGMGDAFSFHLLNGLCKKYRSNILWYILLSFSFRQWRWYIMRCSATDPSHTFLQKELFSSGFIKIMNWFNIRLETARHVQSDVLDFETLELIEWNCCMILS